MAFLWLTRRTKLFSRKKFLSSLAALCLLSLLGSFAHARLSQWLPSATYTDIASFLKNNGIETLDEYIVWLQQNVSYISDINKADWADPVLTLNRRGGDCEDIAFLNEEIVR